ncbi:MAG: hypothetical protein IZT59_06935 [Verrucomicrobia bacterium]|jgi:hypothetical protein|nr:hypothetical protein [Verrucomicrobiota bacterium]|tara:strand:+ start:1951 stop:2604 length:654 start_codon:yes stop_codon:yes gene_type:complete
MMTVGLIVGLVVASAVTSALPKVHESSATIDIPMEWHFSEVGNSPVYMSPDWFSKEIDRIISRSARDRVIRRLELADKWGMDREGTLIELRLIVKAERIRDTSFISISGRHTDRETARDIVAELARAYRDYRIDLEPRSLDTTVSEMRKAVRTQEEKVGEGRKALASMERVNQDPLSKTELSENRDYLTVKRNFENDVALLPDEKIVGFQRRREGYE